MNIYDLIIIFLLFLCAYAIWQHMNISRLARIAAKKYCDREGVQLLDQNVILKKVSICRSPQSLFAFRRMYRFEFSTVGDFRYQGSVALIGDRIDHIELEPFKVH